MVGNPTNVREGEHQVAVRCDADVHWHTSQRVRATEVGVVSFEL